MQAFVLAALLSIAPPQGGVETDLAVTISWPDGAPRHRWWRVAPRIGLVNRSQSATHRVVKSGDGSDAGWREPYLHATVERLDEAGAWIALPPQMSARCGIYHPNWLPDVVDLAPGASIELEWLEFSPHLFQDDRPHRVTVHYEYRRQPVRAEEGRPPPPEGLGRMGDLPAFHLVSEPSELRFQEDERAASLRVHLEGIDSPARWSEVRASAVIENLSSDATARYVAPDANEATMPWDDGWGISEPVVAIDVQRLREDGLWIPVRDFGQPRPKAIEADWRRRVRALEPKERMELSPSRPLMAPSTPVGPPVRVRLRARYAYRALPRLPEPGARLRYPEALGEMADVPPFTVTSEWIEVDLLPEKQRMQEKPAVGYDDTPFLPGGQWRVHDGTRPSPPVVKPGNPPGEFAAPPSDAVVLFEAVEIIPGKGDLQSKESFGDCQLHLEFLLPPPEGDGQHRGNSGLFLMGRYEIQILDSFENPTYADGQCAALYGQYPPLVNACRKPGEWQSYDVIFRAPRFEKGDLAAPAIATVLHNGVLVHDHAEILGDTAHRAVAKYAANDGTGPLRLQDHGSPVRFRNVWIRRLTARK